MRKLTEPFLSISNLARALQALAVFARAPKSRLHDPLGFFQQALAEAKRLADLDGAALQAVGVSLLQWAWFGLDDARGDVWELSELGAEELACWACADNQDVDFGWERGLEVGFLGAFELVFERVVAAVEAVEVVLHVGGEFVWTTEGNVSKSRKVYLPGDDRGYTGSLICLGRHTAVHGS